MHDSPLFHTYVGQIFMPIDKKNAQVLLIRKLGINPKAFCLEYEVAKLVSLLMFLEQ